MFSCDLPVTGTVLHEVSESKTHADKKLRNSMITPWKINFGVDRYRID